MNRRGVAPQQKKSSPTVTGAIGKRVGNGAVLAVDVSAATRDSPRHSELGTPPVMTTHSSNTTPSSPRTGLTAGVRVRQHASGFGARAAAGGVSSRSQRGHHAQANDEVQRQRALALCRFRFMVAVWCARFLTRLRHGLIVRKLKLHIQNVIEPQMAFRVQCAFRRFRHRKLQRMRDAAKKIVMFLRPHAMHMVVLKVLLVSKFQRLGRGLTARSQLADIRRQKVRRLLRSVLSRPLRIVHAKNIVSLLRSLKDERDLFVTQAVVASHAIVREQRLAFQAFQALKFDVIQGEKRRLRAALESLALFEQHRDDSNLLRQQLHPARTAQEESLVPLKSLTVEIPIMSDAFGTAGADEFQFRVEANSSANSSSHHHRSNRGSVSTLVGGNSSIYNHHYQNNSSIFLDSAKPMPWHADDGGSSDAPSLRESLSACLRSITGVFAPVMASTSSGGSGALLSGDSSIFANSAGRGGRNSPTSAFRAFQSGHEYIGFDDDTHRMIEEVFHRSSATHVGVGIGYTLPTPVASNNIAAGPFHSHLQTDVTVAVSPSTTTATPPATESPEYQAVVEVATMSGAEPQPLPSLLEDTTSANMDGGSSPLKVSANTAAVGSLLASSDERSPTTLSRAPTLSLRVASASSMLLPPSINNSSATPSPLRAAGSSSYLHSSQQSSGAPSPRTGDSDYEGGVSVATSATDTAVACDTSPRAAARSGLFHGSFALTPAPPISRSSGSISGSPHPSNASAASFRGLSRRKSSRFGASTSYAQMPLDDVQLAFAALLEQTESIERKSKQAEMLRLLKAMQSHVEWCIEVIRYRDSVPRPFVSLLPHLSPSWVLHSALKLFDSEVEERSSIVDEYDATPLLFLGRPIMGSNSERRRKRMKELLHQRAEKLFEAFVGSATTHPGGGLPHNHQAGSCARTSTPSALRRGTLAAAALRGGGINSDGSILSPTEMATIAAFGGLPTSNAVVGLPSLHPPHPPSGGLTPSSRSNRPYVHVSLSSRAAASEDDELGSLTFQEFVSGNSGATSLTDSVPLISPRGGARAANPGGRFREIDTSRPSIFCGPGGVARSPGGGASEAWKTPRGGGGGGGAVGSRLLSTTEALVPGVFADHRKGTLDTSGGATPMNAFRSAARAIVSPRSTRQAFFEDESEKSVSQRNAILPMPQAPSKRVTFTGSADALGMSLSEDNSSAVAYEDREDPSLKDDKPVVQSKFSGADFQMGIGQSWHVPS
jgi:hypothetical protein